MVLIGRGKTGKTSWHRELPARGKKWLIEASIAEVLTVVVVGVVGVALAVPVLAVSAPTWKVPGIDDIKSTSARFHWNTVSGATKYHIYLNEKMYAESSDGYERTTDAGNAALTPCTSYSVKVVAYAGGVWSAASASKTFKTTGCTTTPVTGSAPTNLRQVPVATDPTTIIRAEWNAPATGTVSTYKHYLDGVLVFGADDPTTAESFTGLAPGSTHTVQVGAIINGVEYRTSAVSMSTQAAAPVPAPTTPIEPSDPTAPTTTVPSSTEAAVVQKWGTVVAGDEFNYVGAPNATKWSVYDSLGHAGKGIRSPQQVKIDGTKMVMNGTADGTTAGMGAKFARQKYGRWEVRAAASGDNEYHMVSILWPDSENWPCDGEIDYAETTGDWNVVNFFHHYSCNNSQISASKALNVSEFHNYAVDWAPNRITGYIDGVKWFETTNTAHMPPGPMHQTLQLDWFPDSTTNGTAEMRVDWVRVYAPASTTTTTTPTPVPTGTAPTNLHAVTALNPQSEITVEWTAPTNYTGVYKHYLDGVYVTGADDNTTRETFAGLAAGSTHTVQIGATINGTEYRSNIITVTVAGSASTPPPATESAPTNLHAVTSINPQSEITTEWTASAGYTGLYKHYLDGVYVIGADDSTTREVFAGLAAGSTHTIQVSATINGVEYKSNVISVTVASATTPPATTGSFRFAAVGDMNPSGSTSTTSSSGKNAASIKAAIDSGELNNFIGVGDFQYSVGNCDNSSYPNDTFRKWEAAGWGPIKSKTLWVAGPNHDHQPGRNVDFDRWMDGQCVSTTKSATNTDPTRTNANGTGTAAGFQAAHEWYSVDKGNWHILFAPSGAWRYNATRAQAMTAEMDRNLATAKAAGKHLAVVYHDPYFTSSTSSHDRETDVKPWIDMFWKNRVKVLLSGSQHNYERTCPVNNVDQCVPDGMQQFQVSTGGISLRAFTSNPAYVQKKFSDTWGHLRMDLKADGSYSWNFVPVSGGMQTDSGSRTP